MMHRIIASLTLLLLFTLSACGNNYKAGTAPDDGSGESESDAASMISASATGYLRYRTGFALYLTNNSKDEIAEITGASFANNPDGAFQLYKWKQCGSDEIISEVFTKASLAPGCTLTFTILFYPSQLKEHRAIFEVFHANQGGGSLRYNITGSVLQGTPPDGTEIGCTRCGNETPDGDDDGEEPDDGGDSQEPSDTPAVALSGDKKIKLSKLYSYLLLKEGGGGGTPVAGPSSAYVNVAFADSTFTLKKITKEDDVIIKTDPNNTNFKGADIVVTSDTEVIGTFTDGSVISLDNVPLRLRAEGLTTILGENGIFEIAFSIPLTTAETVIPSDLFTAEDITKMKEMFRSESVSDTSLTGIFPTEGSRSILLVGCSVVAFEDVIASQVAKGQAFEEDGTPICVEIEGTVIEND